MSDEQTAAETRVADTGNPEASDLPHEEEAQTDYEQYTVEDLQTLARQRDLKVSGSKAELVARHELYDMEGSPEEPTSEGASNPTANPDSPVEMSRAVRQTITDQNEQAAELHDHADGDDPLGKIRAPGDDADLGFGKDPLADVRAPGDNAKVNGEDASDPLADIRGGGDDSS